MDFSFTDVLDFLGTFAFAISGIRLAAGKNIDWFGAYILGLVTAIGGGTVRDLLLNVTLHRWRELVARAQSCSCRTKLLIDYFQFTFFLPDSGNSIIL